MSSPMDGKFTGIGCTVVDASNETSTAMGFQRPSFDGFNAQNERGTATGSQTGFPGGGDSVQQGQVGWQSDNDYQGFERKTGSDNNA